MATPDLRPDSLFRVFLFTDLAGSTDLKVRLGDHAAASALAAHDEAFRVCRAKYHGAEEKETGDGFLAIFERPTDALLCALEFQEALATLDVPVRLHARVGIHAGEILRYPRESDVEGSPRDKFVGLAIDTASRVMNLAEPDQILMTRAQFDSARQMLTHAPNGAPIEWHAHGPYSLKGIEEPIEIFEAGIAGRAPLRRPKETEKGRSATPAGDELTLGWRPAAGQEVMGRHGWILERLLGTGGFGEVWVARHHTTHEARTFKFCFKADRLRNLKRELTLFRLIKEVLGQRPDIARLYDVRLDEAPYFLEMEYTAGGDLVGWAQKQGGLAAVPLETRLKIAAQVATALAAAHSVGVIHKDVKPTNVLIEEGGGDHSEIQARLTDFGIGQLMSREQLLAAGITAEGFSTQDSAALSELSSRTGTRLYMAPELLAGREPSIQTDIYALGVMLYQLVLGDPFRPLGQGWERDVRDELLRSDIAACVDGRPESRLQSAADVAERLNSLDRRRAEKIALARAREELEKARNLAELSRRRRRQLIAVSILAMAAIVSVSTVAIRESRLRSLAQSEERRADAEAQRAVDEATRATGIKNFIVDVLEEPDPRNEGSEHARTALEILEAAESRIGELADQPEIQLALLNILTGTYMNMGLFDRALAVARRAIEIHTSQALPKDLEFLAAKSGLAGCLYHTGSLEEAKLVANELLSLAEGIGPSAEKFRARAYLLLSMILESLGDLAGAEASARRALEVLELADEEEREKRHLYRMRLGQVLRSAGRLDESERVQRENLEELLERFGPDDYRAAEQMNSLAFVLTALEGKAEARELYDKAVMAQWKSLGATHRQSVQTLENYTRVCETVEQLVRIESIATDMWNDVIAQKEADSPRSKRLSNALDSIRNRKSKAERKPSQ